MQQIGKKSIHPEQKKRTYANPSNVLMLFYEIQAKEKLLFCSLVAWSLSLPNDSNETSDQGLPT